jgi:CBS domain-containing protein
MRKVRDVMSAAPACVGPGESVSVAARAMKRHGIGTVLVLAGGRLNGLLTDRDITVRVLAENRDPGTTSIGDVCSGEPAVLGPDDDVAEAVRLVREHAVRRIPVLQEGVPVGVVHHSDLARDEGISPGLSGVWPGRPDS